MYRDASSCSAAFNPAVLRTMPAAPQMSCVKCWRLEATHDAAGAGSRRADLAPVKSACDAACCSPCDAATLQVRLCTLGSTHVTQQRWSVGGTSQDAHRYGHLGGILMMCDGGLHGAVGEDQALQQRVRGQAVGSMQARACNLAARIQTSDIRLTYRRARQKQSHIMVANGKRRAQTMGSTP